MNKRRTPPRPGNKKPRYPATERTPTFSRTFSPLMLAGQTHLICLWKPPGPTPVKARKAKTLAARICGLEWGRRRKRDGHQTGSLVRLRLRPRPSRSRLKIPTAK